MLRIIFAVVAFILISTAVNAAERATWTTIGIGSDSCASYVLALNKNNPTDAMQMQGSNFYTMANAYSQWIAGYITSANMRRKAGSSQMGVDFNGIMLWVKKYCEAHPDEMLLYGAGAFEAAHPAH